MTDKKLLSIAKSFRGGILGKMSPKNMCYAVCSPLQSFLYIGGVNLELKEVEINIDGEDYEHYILVLPDGRILDPTASQFNNPDGYTMPEIYLGDRPQWYKSVKEKELSE